MKIKFVTTAFVLMPVLAHSENLLTFDLNLSEAESKAKSFSQNLKSTSSSVDAAQFQAKSAHSSLLPNLSIQGAYFYNTEVPTFSIGPTQTVSFGTNNNYMIGPVLTYTIFDGGKDRQNFKSGEALAQSRSENFKAQTQQVELNVRQSYFQVQYALRQMVLTANSLKLSQAQDRDIELRFRAGASSRLDQITAHRDVYNYQLKFRQAQTDLAMSLRALISLIGDTRSLDTSRPIPSEIADALPPSVEAATLVVQLDSLDKTFGSFMNRTFRGPSAGHPEVKALSQQVEYSRLAADSEQSALWPKIQLQAKSQLEYPNVVLPEHAVQNTFGATVSLPLFEGDLSRSRAGQHLAEAQQSEFQKEQRLTDLSRNYFQASDGLKSLESQQVINKKNVDEAQEVEKLTYQAYRAGKVRYLDVEDANLKLLEAEVTQAQIESQILAQVASLDYLSFQ